MSSTNLTGASVYYPLAVGNSWQYRQKDGSSFTNRVTGADPAQPDQFVMVNSIMNKDQLIRKEGDAYYTDSFEANNYQLLLKDNLTAGDSWEIRFNANGIESVLVMTVREVGASRQLEGTTYQDVAMLEAESKMVMSGRITPLNFFTQYYYARGVGLILTTSSAGDEMSLVSYELK